MAGAVGDALGATVLRSDEVRKELAGLPTHHHTTDAFDEGIYTPTATADTYGALLARAEVALAMGETVILDASWGEERWRDLARAVAARTHADMVELRCQVATDVAAERIRSRAAAGRDPSDASPGIAAAMAVSADPWPTATTIPTGGPPSVSVAEALDAVGAPTT